MPPYMVTYGPKANCTLELCPVEYSVYGYRPSLVANIVLIALYSVAIAIHTYLGIRWKQWWFMGCMVAGGVNAVLGYVGRLLMYQNPFNFVAFMIQISKSSSLQRRGRTNTFSSLRDHRARVLLRRHLHNPRHVVSAQPAISVRLRPAADLYRITQFSPELSRFDPKLFYYIIIPCDIVSLVLQAAGGGLSSKSSGQSTIGVDLAIAGMAFQVVTIVVFCGFFADFLIRYFRSGAWEQEKHQAQGLPSRATPKRLGLFFGFMGLAVILILARCTFRLVELREGYSGKLVKDEMLFIGLEGV